ncbi:recombinase family protein [Paenibacillus ottowii]|uniref:Recombinase family protein n=1 Tax=Paenibacillus ottowii TaxID=2315729 RepID=A0ABY3BAM5_9BACL|nr:recombinase family protein [Paenibacillus ottowii]TQS01355.1 recombinase family protein [Paenibacillus ottowii]TQS01410.1 recombinase family protein [Paenibacillus ottowii]
MAPVSADFLLSLGIENIINYLRKSRADEEHERRTGEDVLKAQKELMDRVLEPLGIPYTQRPEVGSGDKISTRPVFQGVIDDLRMKKYQAIAVKEISRMGRGSYTDMGVIYDLIVDNRIFILTPYKLYDPRNPSDLRQIRFELFMSREEFETTRERLFGGRVNNAIAGRWVAGPAPFGFDYDKDSKKLVINEEEASIVRMIFDYYVNGVPESDGTRRAVSFRALATYISKKTLIRTPKGKKEWHPNQLLQLISNERYIGTLRFRTTQRINGKMVQRPEEEHIIVPDAFPAIISPTTWLQAQGKLIDSAHKPRNKMDFSPCELAGLCVCQKCGRRMVRQYSVQNYKTKSGTINKYHKEFLWCTTSGCTFLKYRSIEEDLLEVLRHFSNLDKDILQEQLSQLIAEDKKVNYKEDVSSYIESRSKELKKRMNFIYEKYETGKYTDEMFDERKAEIDSELQELALLEAEASKPLPTERNQIDIDVVKNNLTSVLEAYQAAEDKSDRNKILRSVFDRVIVELTERGRGRIPAKYVLYPVLKPGLVTRDFFSLMSI